LYAEADNFIKAAFSILVKALEMMEAVCTNKRSCQILCFEMYSLRPTLEQLYERIYDAGRAEADVVALLNPLHGLQVSFEVCSCVWVFVNNVVCYSNCIVSGMFG
jgi:hypothetical protein